MTSHTNPAIPTVHFRDLGFIDFKEAWDHQEALLKETLDKKTRNRDRATEQQEPTANYLLFCEHPHVYTLGKSGDESNLLASPEELEKKGIAYYRINRGGDITYHGPGQVVGYPIFDLDHFFTDIHRYLRYLEDAIIRTLAEYGIEGDRLEGATGVWLDVDDPAKARKICAIGVKCSRWITMHGFALNVNAQLSYFDGIVPCGISNKAVTSIQKELGGKEVDMEAVKRSLKTHLKERFGFKWAPTGSLEAQ